MSCAANVLSQDAATVGAFDVKFSKCIFKRKNGDNHLYDQEMRVHEGTLYK